VTGARLIDGTGAADLVVLGKDLLANIANLRTAQIVVRGGRVVKRCPEQATEVHCEKVCARFRRFVPRLTCRRRRDGAVGGPG